MNTIYRTPPKTTQQESAEFIRKSAESRLRREAYNYLKYEERERILLKIAKEIEVKWVDNAN